MVLIMENKISHVSSVRCYGMSFVCYYGMQFRSAKVAEPLCVTDSVLCPRSVPSLRSSPKVEFLEGTLTVSKCAKAHFGKIEIPSYSNHHYQSLISNHDFRNHFLFIVGFGHGKFFG